MSQSVTLGSLLQDAENTEITLLDAGTYECEIVNCKPRDTDVMPTLKVVSGPYAGKRAMIGAISFNGQAGPRFFARMRELGLTKEWFVALGTQLPGPEVSKAVASALTGRVAVFDINQEPYKQEMRNKLVKVDALVSVPQGSGAQAGVPVVAAPVAAVPAAAPVMAAPAPPLAPAPVAPVAVAVAPAPVAPAPVPFAAVPAPVAAVMEVPAPVPAPVPVAAVPVAAPPVVTPAPAAAAPDDDPGF